MGQAVAGLGTSAGGRLITDKERIDISRETVEALENTDARFGRISTRHGYQLLARGSACLAFAGLAAVMVLFVPYRNLNFVMAGIFFAIGGAALLVLGVSFAISGLRAVFGPAPKSGRTPEATVRQYLEGILNGLAGHEPYSLPPYVCLLDQLKQREGGYDAFVRSSKRQAEKLSKEIRVHCASGSA